MGRKRTIDRNALLDAAENIVQTCGVAGLTIDSVAKAMGITKGGVQYAFGNRDGLIDAMQTRWDAEFDNQVTALLGSDPSPEDRIRAHVEASRAVTSASAARAAVMITVLVQNSRQLEQTRKWYETRLSGLDLNTEESRRARLAFLAAEGIYYLRYFNFLPVSDEQWLDIFKDIKKLFNGDKIISDHERVDRREAGRRDT